MYYKFKIILYETGKILESSRFYAKRGNARRYLLRYCYQYIKRRTEAVRGQYLIQISSESGMLLYSVCKLKARLYYVAMREGWREEELIETKYLNSIPKELEINPYFILNDLNGYGPEYPICVDREEAERLAREWGKQDFDEIWREATESEIETYGCYDTEVEEMS